MRKLIPRTIVFGCLLAGLASLVPVQAGTFTNNFNTDPATAVQLNGVAYWTNSGSFDNSGYISLTDATGNQQGNLILPDLDPGKTIGGFIMTFKVRVGGGTARPADGFSVSFGPGIDESTTTSEEGVGTGVSICFDTWDNNGADTAPAIDVKVGGNGDANIVGTAFLDGQREGGRAPLGPLFRDPAGNTVSLETGTNFVDVRIELKEGLMDLQYKGIDIFKGLAVPFTPTQGRFIMGARTGGANDNQWVDNLSVTTLAPATTPTISGFTGTPLGVTIQVTDATTQVNPTTIKLSLDGTAVTPTVTKSGTVTTIAYTTPSLLAPGSSHVARLEFADNGTPPVTRTNDLSFTVASYVAVPPGLATAAVDRTKPGFKVRPYQVETTQPNTLARAEDELAGLKGANIADVSGADASGYYIRDTVINFDVTGGIGNFQPDDAFPGIPGTLGGTDNTALEALTFLDLPGGIITMGVNSDDGFRVATGLNPLDKLAVTLGQFDGGRGTADTLFTIFVAKAGVYPFRLIWENGTGGANLEWFTVNNGTKVLINDSATAGAIKAYREGSTPPYVKSVSPAPGATLVPLNTSINITLVDAATAVATNSIQLFLNSQPVTPTITKPAGSKETTVSYKPASDLPRALHTVRLIYGDNATPAAVFTNDFTFSTEDQILFTYADNTQWSYNRDGIDLGTAWKEKNFNDSAWPKGMGPLGDNNDNSEIVPIRTAVSRLNDAGDEFPTLYLRGHFNFPGTNTVGVTLSLSFEVDDGAVFYLNGVEVNRFGLGAGLAFNFNTLFAGNEADHISGPYVIPSGSLVPGDNVFAVEVHQSSLTSSDIVYGGQLTFKIAAVGDTTPPRVVQAQEGATLDTIQVSFSEELQVGSAQNPANYSLAPTAGGANLTVTSAVLNSGTNVVLTTSPRTAGVFYTVTVKDVKDLAGNTLSPNPSAVAVLSRLTLFTFADETAWSYNRDGVDLGAAWRDKNYNDSAWPKGVGPLGDNGDNSEVVPIRTAVSRMNDAGVEYPTLYLRGHFNFPRTSTAGAALSLRFEVDDGAVIYLNGAEVYRFGIAAGTSFDFNTLFAGNEADHISGPFDISAASLVPGDNAFAVEVHQSSLTSSDIVYGGELTALLSPVTTVTPARMTVARSGANVVISWTETGTLQSADSVTGPWTDLTGASPQTVNASTGTKFYRVKR